MAKTPNKLSYTIPCSSDFRDSVTTLAQNLHLNVADLARSILLIFPEKEIRRFPDPGEPKQADRDNILLKTGKSGGKVLRRKPRLQVRLRAGYSPSIVRRALNIVLKLKAGSLELNLNNPNSPNQSKDYMELLEKLDVLKNINKELAFIPLKGGVSNIEEALHVLGFSPNENPDKTAIRVRFRRLATIHHPDSICGSHHRMTQINAAMEILCK